MSAPLIANLVVRARIIEAIRTFFAGRGYLEVETPCRIPAPIPEADIFPQSSDGWFLQTSPEVCMKRLLCRGFSRIFQICKAFRRHERGRKHLPEFTLLEWYRTDAGYKDLMHETEALIRFVAEALDRNGTLSYRGNLIDLSGEWPRITVGQALSRYAGVGSAEGLTAERFNILMVETVEPNLGLPFPVFIHDFPADIGGALARLKSDDPRYAERFELYIGQLELCNGFSELTGTDEYRFRFEKARRELKKTTSGGYPWPESFLADMDHMPPAAGNALGIDRLTMLFCDTEDISTVVALTPEDL